VVTTNAVPGQLKRVFLSYAWESDEFRLWAKRLAMESAYHRGARSTALSGDFEQRFESELARFETQLGRRYRTPRGHIGRFAEGVMPARAYKEPFLYFAADGGGTYEEITFSCDKSCNRETMRTVFETFICSVDYVD
jgi:hypothetical protein